MMIVMLPELAAVPDFGRNCLPQPGRNIWRRCSILSSSFFSFSISISSSLSNLQEICINMHDLNKSIRVNNATPSGLRGTLAYPGGGGPGGGPPPPGPQQPPGGGGPSPLPSGAQHGGYGTGGRGNVGR